MWVEYGKRSKLKVPQPRLGWCKSVRRRRRVWRPGLSVEESGGERVSQMSSNRELPSDTGRLL
jgi:hypothetical protein